MNLEAEHRRDSEEFRASAHVGDGDVGRAFAGASKKVAVAVEAPALPRLWSADAAGRKLLPIISGCLWYFPDALAAVSHVSYVGNQQHNPGQPMHWAQDKSKDHVDCIGRHLAQLGSLDTDGVPHSWKLAWRALANLQMELQGEGAPKPPGAILPQR